MANPLTLQDLQRIFTPEYLNKIRQQDIYTQVGDPSNQIRPHLSLAKDSSCHRPVQPVGSIVSRPILGGLHHQYCPT